MFLPYHSFITLINIYHFYQFDFELSPTPCDEVESTRMLPLSRVLRSSLPVSGLCCRGNAAKSFSLESSFPAEAEEDKLYKIVELELRGNDPAVLRSYKKFSHAAAGHLDVNILKSWTPAKPHHERYTLLRSIHVNKKCRTQYEFRTYYSFIQFEKLTGSTCDTLLEYLERNLPEGVALKATKVLLEKIPQHIQPPQQPTAVLQDETVPPL
ncbi:Ribosomal protein S10 [Nesidiocoris tenuis]|uniref:Small ribosomal subunit protein uS10m n=1 Tax=Nesidiocoris tenuis TaxID=355587 RepID=A0ABN7ANJ3_9HEMI|nr:Ribosomal protein S10 [Nesidiocoris tenuis]